jgi:hypothetical protein
LFPLDMAGKQVEGVEFLGEPGRYHCRCDVDMARGGPFRAR